MSHSGQLAGTFPAGGGMFRRGQQWLMELSADVDPYAVLRSLGISGVSAVRSVSGGSTTAIWRVHTASERYALRVFAPGHEEVCAREMARTWSKTWRAAIPGISSLMSAAGRRDGSGVPPHESIAPVQSTDMCLQQE